MATNMSGAQFFVQTMKTFDDMEYRREQSLRDESFRRDQLAERTRQFDLSHKMNGRRVSVAEKNLKLAETSAANLKEKEQKVKAAKLAYLNEQQEREAFKAEQRETFSRGYKRLRSGEMVDISHFAYGPNVDPTMLNGARGNSGRGAGVFTKYDAETGRHYAFTKDQETGEYLPFSRDPEDNESPQLFFEDTNIMESLFTINGTRNDIEQMDEDGSVMSAFYGNNMNLITDENGRVITRRRAEIEGQARREVDAQNAQIEKENARRMSEYEAQQPTGEPDTIIKGREGGIADKVANAFNSSVIIPSSAPMVGLAHGVSEIFSAETGDKIMNTLFGELTPEAQEQKAAAIKAKTKGKPPEMVEKIVYKEYLREKYGDTFKGTELEVLAKYRSGSIGAIEATEDKRRKVAELMIDAGEGDAAKLDNYIKTGSMKTPAELAKEGLQTKSDLLAYAQEQVKFALDVQKFNEKGEPMPMDEQLNHMVPMVERAVEAVSNINPQAKGASGMLAQEKAKWVSAFSHWHQATGQSVPVGNQSFYTGIAQVHNKLSNSFSELGFASDSMFPAIVLATRRPEMIGNDEFINNFAKEIIAEHNETGKPVDQIMQEFMVE